MKLAVTTEPSTVYQELIFLTCTRTPHMSEQLQEYELILIKNSCSFIF